jgi:hypothetical protein
MSKPLSLLWLLGGAVGALTSCTIPVPIASRAAWPTEAAGAAPPAAIGSLTGEPQRRRQPASTSRSPRTRGYVTVSTAFGDFEFKDDVLGKDDSRAYMQRIEGGVMTPRGIGGGGEFKVFVPHDDFYERTVSRTEAAQVEFYGYFQADPSAHATDGRFRMPMRIGPYFSNVAAEFTVSGDDTDYSSFGLRAELLPELVLSPPHQDFEASLVGRLSAGTHSTSIDDESTDEVYWSSGYSLGVEVGFRVVIGPISLSTAYIHHTSTVRESDTERNLFIPRLETDFEGVLFSVGASF